MLLVVVTTLLQSVAARSRPDSTIAYRHGHTWGPPSGSLPLAIADSLRGGSDESTESDAPWEDSSNEEPPIRQPLADQTETIDDDKEEEKDDGDNDTRTPELDNSNDQQQQQPTKDPPEALLPTVVDTTTTTVLKDTDSDENMAISPVAPAPSADGVDDEPDNPQEIMEQASVLRLTGKDLHDLGDYAEAALSFGAAADILSPLLYLVDSSTEEFATCRLHEALCRLKATEYEEAVMACSEVLGMHGDSVAPALRARAFHRRAKAQLELGESTAALQDARSAAFLGDRKAVALYGKLMRESSPAGSSSSSILSSSAVGESSMSSADSLAASSALLESLLNKSSGNLSSLGDSMSSSSSSGGSGLPFSPLSLLSSMGQPSGAGQGGLAKSVLTSLSKRIDDKQTQDTICRYLQGTSGPQLQQMAGMAGMQLQPSQASKIATFCNSVTPRTIRRTVKTTKRAVYGVQMIRKTMKLISKYRNILIMLALLAWIKSALLRPIPINKRAARRAAKEAVKVATTVATAAF